jgi:hypothetical protein
MDAEIPPDGLTQVVSTRAVALSFLVEAIEFEEQRDVAEDSFRCADGVEDPFHGDVLLGSGD